MPGKMSYKIIIGSFIMSLLAAEDGLIYKGETHFNQMRQLTFAGENAEAYFSAETRYI